jgi:hypothetical protein
MSGLPLEPVPDVAAAAARCEGKALHMEGIPMVLALEDVTAADQPGPAGAGAADLGAVLAERLARYHRALFPAAEADEYWPVHDALVVVADAHAPARAADAATTATSAGPASTAGPATMEGEA